MRAMVWWTSSSSSSMARGELSAGVAGAVRQGLLRRQIRPSLFNHLQVFLSILCNRLTQSSCLRDAPDTCFMQTVDGGRSMLQAPLAIRRPGACMTSAQLSSGAFCFTVLPRVP